jgi:hypothetical protein
MQGFAIAVLRTNAMKSQRNSRTTARNTEICFTNKHLKIVRPHSYFLRHGIAYSQLLTGQVVSCSDYAPPLVIATPRKFDPTIRCQSWGAFVAAAGRHLCSLARIKLLARISIKQGYRKGYNIVEARLMLVFYPVLFYRDKQLSANAAKRLNGYHP